MKRHWPHGPADVRWAGATDCGQDAGTQPDRSGFSGQLKDPQD